MRLPAAPRFVKPSAQAARVLIGSPITVPTSDHVPELIYAQSSPSIGIPATAEAVSWHAGAISNVLWKAGNPRSAPSTFPTREPVATNSGAASRLNPQGSNTSGHHLRVAISTS